MIKNIILEVIRRVFFWETPGLYPADIAERYKLYCLLRLLKSDCWRWLIWSGWSPLFCKSRSLSVTGCYITGCVRGREQMRRQQLRLLRPQITLDQPSFSLPDYLGPPTATLQPTLTVWAESALRHWLGFGDWLGFLICNLDSTFNIYEQWACHSC